MKTEMKARIRWLMHNTLVHPICGVLWFFEFNELADRIHNLDDYGEIFFE